MSIQEKAKKYLQRQRAIRSSNKRGQVGFNLLISGIISLLVVGVVVFLIMLMSAEFQDATTDQEAIDAINATARAIDDVIDWLPIIVIMLVVVVIILLLVLVINALRRGGLMDGGA